jgi:thiamine kinase-like enzyme
MKKDKQNQGETGARFLCEEILRKHSISAGQLTLVAKGASSVVFKAGLYAIKIKLAKGGNLENEFLTLKQLWPLKVCPKPYAYGTYEGKHYLIEEFIRGKRFPIKRASANEVRLAAEFFKHLQRRKFQKVKYSPLTQLAYPKQVQRKISRSKAIPAALKKWYAKVITEVAEHIKENSTPTMVSFVWEHNDPGPYNLYVLKDRVVAIDWEFARKGYYAVDVAGFIRKAHFTRKQRTQFFEAYGAVDPKDIRIHTMTALLSMSAWHAERILLYHKGHIDRKLWSSSVNPDASRGFLEKDLREIEALLRA